MRWPWPYVHKHPDALRVPSVSDTIQFLPYFVSHFESSTAIYNRVAIYK